MHRRNKVAIAALQFRLENLSPTLSSLFNNSIEFHRRYNFLNSLKPLIAQVKARVAGFQNGNYHYRRSQSLPWTKIIVGLIALVVVGLAGRALIRTVASKTPSSPNTNIAAPYKTLELNREFSYTVKNSAGEDTDMKIHFKLEKLELAKEIVAKGQRATAISGRSFLLLTIKLTNNEEVGIEIDTRDYVRLSVDGSEEKLAADIHNDPVEVQPLSTKTTRIGFPVNDTIKKVTLYIGEIKGEKEAIAIDL